MLKFYFLFTFFLKRHLFWKSGSGHFYLTTDFNSTKDMFKMEGQNWHFIPALIIYRFSTSVSLEHLLSLLWLAATTTGTAATHHRASFSHFSHEPLLLLHNRVSFPFACFTILTSTPLASQNPQKTRVPTVYRMELEFRR